MLDSLKLLSMTCWSFVLLVWVVIAEYRGRCRTVPTPPEPVVRLDPEGTPREDVFVAIPREGAPKAFGACLAVPWTTTALAIDNADASVLWPRWERVLMGLEGS